ncbi:beta-carotene isomerase domain-containing protein [Streptomyces sp. NPDC058953]|uniref:beta-carotene isomerase domain-containing protein n=1 Tax=unclassified Streptomyces TaxID=2593676 RepID=UPI0036A34B85
MIDSLFLKKFNTIRRRHLGYHSPHTGWEEFIDATFHEDRHITDDRELARTIAASYIDFMGGPRTVRGMGRFARRYPRTATRILALLTPRLFRWLVGPMERTGKHELRITRCTFLTSTNPAMCHRICKVPTEEYFTGTLSIPLTLTPDVRTAACDVTFTPYAPPTQEPKPGPGPKPGA